MNVGIVVGTIKSQGLFWAEVSVSMIGWPAVIDGARPAGRPPKSILTDGKDEMALGTLAATTTIKTMQPAPPLNSSMIFKIHQS